MTNGATKATEYSDSVTVRRHYLPLLSLSFELITRTRYAADETFPTYVRGYFNVTFDSEV